MTRRFDLKKLQPLRQYFRDEGWREVKTDTGRSFAKCDDVECLIFNAHEVQLPARIKAEIKWFLDFKEITKIVNTLSPNALRDFLPLTTSLFHSDQTFQIYIEEGIEFSKDDANKFVQRALSWRQTYSPRDQIEKIAKSPIPEAGGDAQLKHLAALAYLADYDTLLDYQKIFRGGKRLNFVPMITTEMIDRAVSIAFERA